MSTGSRSSVASRRARALVATGFATACVLIALPPVLGEAAAATVRGVFDPLCHQLPGRSFHLWGEPLAVCHRCTGIYLGLFAGVLAGREWLSLRQFAPALLLLAVAPAGLDWIVGVLGWWNSPPLVQALTGGWFGVLAGMLVAGGLTELVERLLGRMHVGFVSDSSSSRIS